MEGISLAMHYFQCLVSALCIFSQRSTTSPFPFNHIWLTDGETHLGLLGSFTWGHSGKHSFEQREYKQVAKALTYWSYHKIMLNMLTKFLKVSYALFSIVKLQSATAVSETGRQHDGARFPQSQQRMLDLNLENPGLPSVTMFSSSDTAEVWDCGIKCTDFRSLELLGQLPAIWYPCYLGSASNWFDSVLSSIPKTYWQRQ